MARIDNLTNFITDVANAIKAKLNITSTITPVNFDTLITNIETGTDVSDSTVAAEDVLEGKVFYLADGTKAVGTAPDLIQTITDLENQVVQLQEALSAKAAESTKQT